MWADKHCVERFETAFRPIGEHALERTENGIGFLHWVVGFSTSTCSRCGRQGLFRLWFLVVCFSRSWLLISWCKGAWVFWGCRCTWLSISLRWSSWTSRRPTVPVFRCLTGGLWNLVSCGWCLSAYCRRQKACTYGSVGTACHLCRLWSEGGHCLAVRPRVHPSSQTRHHPGRFFFLPFKKERIRFMMLLLKP